MNNEKLIVIGGGVGPMAGVKLHEKIIESTETDGTDQTHLEVVHLSRSHDIMDRTKFLLKQVTDNPAEGMARTFEMAEAAAIVANKEWVGGVPCNTFHAPEIWDRFVQILKDDGLEIELVHMLNETADYIEKKYPDAKKIGLLSTTGTRSVKVYNQILEPRGFSIVEVPEDVQDELHESIYNPEWGIKAVSPVTEKARGKFRLYLQMLKKLGAQAVILGCTEIPLALPEKELYEIPLIDPVLALARGLIREANPEKLL